MPKIIKTKNIKIIITQVTNSVAYLNIIIKTTATATDIKIQYKITIYDLLKVLFV